MLGTKVICIKCKHHRSEHGPVPEAWYNHTCGHDTALKRSVDYTLGRDVYERAPCRDINPNGDCELYEEK